ncbi:MAG: hypothetical protein M1836_005053 [Candelina mexicana]|nr:MAG: hypothetical protein M1836_005053 [Candelina mexicana]
MSASGDRGPVVLAVTTALIVTSTLFVVLRLISRIGIVRSVSWGDYLIVLAWVIAFGLSFSICYGTSVGLGLHNADIKEEWATPLRKAQYAFSVLYNPALMATKTSILVFLLSLSETQVLFRWATIATLVVVNAAGLALTLLNVFQCRPVGAAFLDPLPSTAYCMDIVTIYLSSAPVNIITDLAILFLPFPILTGMRLPMKQKAILIFTFGLGGFVTIVDVVRIAYLQSAFFFRLQEVSSANVDHTTSRISEENNFSWYASLSFMWTAIEVNVGIIIACIPTMKPLFSRFMPRLLHDMEGSRVKNDSVTSQPDNHTLAMAADQRLPSMPNLPTKKRYPESYENDGREMGFADFLTLPESTAKSQNPDSGVEDGNDMGMMDFLTTSGVEDGNDMGMMDFLTTPETVSGMNRPRTATTGDTGRQHEGNTTFFDFVNMKQPKSMLKMSNRESYAHLALVTVLFFLWGFAYGLLDVLNSQFQLIGGFSNGQEMGLHGAYFGAYFVAPMTFGRVVFKKWGFKATFIIGLCIYGCGTLIFWPSAVLTSFPAFIISNFIVGLGLATLEVAANPFIALCGPPEYAEIRLNISQGFQAIGSVVSPILARRALFRNVLDAPSLIDVQWTYLGIALFVVLLALAFYYLPLPEASDADLQDMADRRGTINSIQFAGMPIIYVTLALAVFSQFCYVGGQESLAMSFESYVGVIRPSSRRLKPNDYQAIGHTLFAVGRFVAAFANYFLTPRWILLFYYLGALITSILSMNLVGDPGMAVVLLLFLFESALFSTIYAISLRGQGRHTKTASAYMTAAVSGGAVWPPIMSPVGSVRGIRYSFCVVVALFAFGTIFPVYLSAVPVARKQVDPRISNVDGDVEKVDLDADASTEHGHARRSGTTIGTLWSLKRSKRRKVGGCSKHDEASPVKQAEGTAFA